MSKHRVTHLFIRITRGQQEILRQEPGEPEIENRVCQFGIHVKDRARR